MSARGNNVKAATVLDDDYRPADDEPFMNERQLEYFRKKLLIWKSELMGDSKTTIEGLQDTTRNIPDIADRASEEADRALELRTRDRQRKLVAKIDKPCAASTPETTAIARTRESQSPSSGWMRARSQR